MANNVLGRYVWIIDTLRRYGALTLERINELWAQSNHYDGRPLARRTFYTYRQAIADLFSITIECNAKTYEYYIDQATSPTDDNFSGWLLNSTMMHSALAQAADVAPRIALEPVPSARRFMPDILQAMRANTRIEFDYHPYTRSRPHTKIIIEPYFLKIFRQRWYMIGRDVQADRVKTYALDRIVQLRLTDSQFVMPDDATPERHFRDLFGIESSDGDVKTVTLKAGMRDAKYLRALPLHASQTELVGDGYSLFTYQMKLTDDLKRELLSMGSSVTVLSPPELRAAIAASLRASLANYDQ